MLSERTGADARAWSVALLATGAVDERRHVDLLSARETAHLARRAAPRRREFLAGRLAAKYLALAGTDAAPFARIDAQRLAAFPARDYRGVEILPDAAGGAPRLFTPGRETGRSVTLSHAGGLCCAALPPAGRAAAVDLEAASPRAGAFYRRTFGAGERRWAASGRPVLSDEWLFTFLWTVKEAAFKSGVTAARGVWDLPGVEVCLPAGPELAAAGRGRRVGERLAAFEAAVDEGGRCTRAWIATTSDAEVVLTLFEALEVCR